MAKALIGSSADIHVDGGRHGGRNPDTGRPRAWESTHAVWLALCEHLAEIKADAAVFPGDFWLNGWPKAEAVEMIADGLRILDRAGIETVIGDGNHEWISRNHLHRSAMEHLGDIDCVRVVTKPELVTLSNGIQIGFLPWPRRADLVDAGELEGLTPQEADELVAARAAEAIEALADQADPSRGPIMLAAHLTVGDATVGSAKRGSELALAELFNEPVVALPDIDTDPWQSVSLGHIHRRQQMGERCWYVGSPDRLDFSDEGLEKAFSVIHLPDDGSIGTVEAIPTAARLFRTVTVAEGADPAELIEASLAGVERPDRTAVKVVLPAGADLAQEAEARRQLEALGISAARISVPPAVRSEDDERVVAAEDVGPIEGLDLWLSVQDVPEETAIRLRGKAAQLICAFRRFRTPVPVDSGHPFRLKPDRVGDADARSTTSTNLLG